MRLTANLIRESPWVPIVPTFKQLVFIALPHRMAFYGGAAGGGKSEALLASAALYAHVPGYVAMLFRRSYADLRLKGALLDRAHEWWGETAARWNSGDNRWEFPGGGTVGFGYLDNPMDHLRYKSMEAQFIGCDEATDMRETHLRYMITRLRRKEGSHIPTRIRFAGNPGGESHVYFGEHFVHPENALPLRPFVPATLEDNPHADREDYEISLAEQDDTAYAQLRYGAWIQDESAVYFKRSWWDRAANRYEPKGHDPHRPTDNRRARLSLARFAALDTAEKKEEHNAFTALTVGELTRDWRMQMVHAAKERLTFDELPDWVAEQLGPWAYDGKLQEVFIEEASSGTQLIQVIDAGGSWLAPLIAPILPHPEGKTALWRAASIWCRRNCVQLPWPHPAMPWLYGLESELFNVPNSPFKDYADSTSMLINGVEDREEHPLSTGWRYREAKRIQARHDVEAGIIHDTDEDERPDGIRW